MASMLPKELVEEILLRVPPYEQGHLVGATLVCKAWHSILSDHRFHRRYHKFHGTPPLQGYICNDYHKKSIRVDPLISIPATSHPVRTPTFHYSSSGGSHSVLDCRHGRVLIQARDKPGWVEGFIIWDPITGSQHHISAPTRCDYGYTGAVLCATDGCDHHDCHGGPSLIVSLRTSKDGAPVRTWAVVYSTLANAWSAPTPNHIVKKVLDHQRPNVHVGDALYFTTRYRADYAYSHVGDGQLCGLLKYDLSKHELSVMDLPQQFMPILFNGDGGGLGVAAMSHDCIQTWSWQVDIKGIAGWVKCNVIKLNDTLLPKGPRKTPGYICTVEGTSTVFIHIDDREIFTLDLKSRQVRKIGERYNLYAPLLLYMNFYTRKY